MTPVRTLAARLAGLMVAAAVAGCTAGTAFGGGPSPSTSSATYSARETRYLRGLSDAGQFSGAVLVAVRGRMRLRTAVGMADVGRHVPNRPGTPFRIGSITKAITATAVMLLVQEGRLRLTDSVCQHVSACPETWKPVTIRDLLRHTSGIPDYLPAITLGQFNAPTPPADLLALVKDRPLLSPPGTAYAYSNTNYVLLGLVIEGASGLDYATFLQRRIFVPLRMTGSGYQRDFSVVPGHATGYGYRTRSTTELIPTDQAAFADGGLYSTVDDLLRFDEALDGDRLLSRTLVEQMLTPWRGPGSGLPSGVQAGLGWDLRTDRPGQQVVFHGGQIPGFNAMLERHLGPRVTAIVLSNFYWAPAPGMASLLASQAERG
jgi:CubicO group peptidase (beta-lactamase class C family)